MKAKVKIKEGELLIEIFDEDNLIDRYCIDEIGFELSDKKMEK
jgi:hypothetical protein